MPDGAPSVGRPLVLLGNAQEWFARSLASILEAAGHTVLLTHSGRDAREAALHARPDTIILDQGLPDADALALCSELRREPAITPSTPILITTSAPTTRQQLLDALRAGATGLWGQPLDTEEFLLRLEGYLRGKFDADSARADSLVDPLTGLYNLRGLTRRAHEVAAEAERRRAALACVVVAPHVAPGEDEPGTDALAALLADAIRAGGRRSDAIGRSGPTEFAVFVVHPDVGGAAQLAARLGRTIESAANRGAAARRPLRLRTGHHAVANVGAAHLNPLELLARATSALRAADEDRGPAPR